MEEVTASYEAGFITRSLRGSVKDALLAKQEKINDISDSNTVLTIKLKEISNQNETLEEKLETSRWEAHMLRASEAALTQRLRSQRNVLQKLQKELRDRSEVKQGFEKLEAIHNTIKSEIAELIIQRNFQEGLKLAAS
ncbi:hypothetical protein ACHAPT_008598 [Fusarium lateritium]